MTWTQVLDWLKFNKVAIGVVAVVLAVIVYMYFQKKKQANLAELNAQVAYEEMQAESNKTSVDLDSLYMNGYHEVNLTEVTNLDRVKKMKELVDDDLKRNVEMYEKAKKQYTELIEIDGRLRKNITLLNEQKKVYEAQLQRLAPEQMITITNLPKQPQPTRPVVQPTGQTRGLWWKTAPIDPVTGKRIMPPEVKERLLRNRR